MSDLLQSEEVLADGTIVETVDDDASVAGRFLSDDQETELRTLVESELSRIETQRESRLTARRYYRRMLANEPNSKLDSKDSERGKVRFTNAADVTVPLVPMLVQTLYAQLMQTFDRSPFWTTSPLQNDNPEQVEQAKVLTKYLNMLAEEDSDLGLSRIKRDAFMESAPMGEVFYKVVYTKDTINWRDGQQSREVILHDGPEIVVVDYEHLLFDDTWESLQKCPTVAHVVTMSEQEFKNKVSQGVYNNESAVLEHPRESPTEDELVRADTQGLEGSTDTRVDLYEVYIYYDQDNDGRLEDLKLFYHRESQTFVRVGYNTFGARPFVAAQHVHRTNRITGIGLCELLHHTQLEMNSLHNMFLDNVKLANSMIVTRRTDAMNKSKDLRINAGGPTVVPVQEHNDLQVFRFGEIYPSLMQAEQSLFQYAMRLCGINEAIAGFPSMQLGSRDTAAGQAQRLTQGGGILSTIARQHEGALSQVGRMVFMRLVQNKNAVLDREASRNRLTERELDALRGALTVENEELPVRGVFRVQTTDIEQTFESKRQNNFALVTMYQQFLESTMQLVQMLFGPQSAQMAQGAPELFMRMAETYLGTHKLMKENFEFFGKFNEDEYLPDVRGLEEKLAQMKELINAVQAQTEGLDGFGGMAGTPPAGAGGLGAGMFGAGGEPLLENAGGLGRAGGME